MLKELSHPQVRKMEITGILIFFRHLKIAKFW